MVSKFKKFIYSIADEICFDWYWIKKHFIISFFIGFVAGVLFDYILYLIFMKGE